MDFTSAGTVPSDKEVAPNSLKTMEDWDVEQCPYCGRVIQRIVLDYLVCDVGCACGASLSNYVDYPATGGA